MFLTDQLGDVLGGQVTRICIYRISTQMELSIQLPHIYRHTVLHPFASSGQFLGIAPTRPLVSFGPWLLFGPRYLQYLGPRFGTCVQYHIATKSPDYEMVFKRPIRRRLFFVSLALHLVALTNAFIPTPEYSLGNL